MPFAPGQSGNPKGRPKDKPWAAALRLAANEPGPDGIKKLRRMAEKCVDKAIEEGDIHAMKEVGDRLDGKPMQAIEASGPEGEPIQVEDVSDKELARRVALLLIKAGKSE